ncbi:AGE family epimerase/isomerase [Lachnoclostridium phytofermentans]|uniref:Cellobiose 2-epimerase n=1 Tax=Lachnoclostridium phytofermentans (strain ATCC 700394 / DSM 18823 / ISDg) TaxID=357809 RepID=A9KK53_LACP7|nr:AGE family epimerase/isomerase [Lachnoclostridium phytofermentans]ABX42625.1 N-acylglucosamine 2-epimerase [Lachnoclostridium phytofermentans ISDg]
MGNYKQMKELAKAHLSEVVIPFWNKLKDEENGGFYGYLDYDLQLDKKAVKGCILNSRILWFYSNAYLTLGEEGLLSYAKHAYEFLKNHCYDQTYGGIYWSLNYDGSTYDTTKHTYNQAFAVYALSSYYFATKDEEAINLAKSIIGIMEKKCTDSFGYLEAFDRDFLPIDNELLSENGVIAHKTMNTLLHVFEAYTEYYRVTGDMEIKERLMRMLDIIQIKVYNPNLHRQEVFFDVYMNSILDLHSYGHDIEAAWLIDRGLDVLKEPKYDYLLKPITKDLTNQIYQTAYQDHSLLNESEKGKVNTSRIWWVQAEAVVGFLNGYENDRNETRYYEAATDIFQFILENVHDKRTGSEWFWEVDKEGKPFNKKPIVEPWKCPYHNGRMCFEILRREI